MKEFIEKLIARLEDKRRTIVTNDEDLEWNRAVYSCTEIVNKFAKEHNGGWISVDERLPETNDNVLCWYEYYRFGEYNGMYQTYGIGNYYKSMDFWGGEVSNGHKCKVIAWKPLPAPYNPKGE